MSIFTTWALRVFGIAGVIGAILFICGDLSYNHIPGSEASPALKMSQLPQSRLLRAGTLGLFGCWFYALASLHVYLAFQPVGEFFSFVFLLLFIAVMICYGIAHTAYFAIAAGAQVAAKTGYDAEKGGELGQTLFQRLVLITYIPVAISSLMMLYGVLSGQSLYPRWMVLFLPVIIYLLKSPVMRILQGRVREVVHDCYDNLVLLVFYTLSTLVLWNIAVR